MKIDFVTPFPETIWPTVGSSIMARAQNKGLATFGCVNPRNFCYDRHAKLDDSCFGGFPGMLIKPEPIVQSLEKLGCFREPLAMDEDQPVPRLSEYVAVVLTDPTGEVFNQALADKLGTYDHVVFLCGHYEGIDERIRETCVTHTVSLGDFVLTNGEIASLVMADAIVRRLPGVLGDQESLLKDSFSSEGENKRILGAPNYTKPRNWRGNAVPEVLLSGDHAKILAWQESQSEARTEKFRPDLIRKVANGLHDAP